jgi:restriction endonuclease S subunit
MREVPEGWRRVKLRDCGTWWSGGTPATEEPRFWGGDIPWISAASLKNFRINDSDRRVTRAGSMAGTKVVEPGTVLFIVRGMSLKREFRVGIAQRRVAFGQDCKALLPHTSIDGTFLALALKARERDILAMVDEAGHGTGRLPIDMLERLEIALPTDPDEQWRIVEILDAVDLDLQVSNDLADKFEKVRSAVMNDLLGDGDNGAPRQYVPSVRALTLTGGLPYQQAHPGKGDIPIYGSSGLAGFGTRSLAQNETIVVGRVGEGGVGSVRYSQSPCWVTDNALWANWINPSWLPEFLALYLDWYGLRKLRAQTGQPLITQSAIAKVPVPVVPRWRQAEIIAEIRTLREQANAAVASVERIQLVKHGLMEDLLTGRVRV